MSGLVECVPNVSEGRNHATIAACARAITSVAAVRLLDTHIDADHHRSVFTLVGPPAAISEAVIRLAAVTTRLIDLRRHQGQHPRMGALDVVPFVPLAGTALGQCSAIARTVAARLAECHGLPVFLYGEAASRPDRRDLPVVRGRGFEALWKSGLADPDTQPDYGPYLLHPSAGATAVGARTFLVAFNVLLATGDATLARQIAREIRTATGGLPGVRALGFRVRGRAQVSMNLVDLSRTPPRAAFRAVDEAASRLGVEIVSSEIVGLIPASAVQPGDTTALRLPIAIESLVLEDRVAEAFA